MGWELRDNSGSLFKNERRQREEHPHMTGTCMIEGKVYYISAWTKEGEKGRFQSLAFRPKDEDGAAPSSRQTGRSTARRNAPADYSEDDDIPF